MNHMVVEGCWAMESTDGTSEIFRSFFRVKYGKYENYICKFFPPTDETRARQARLNEENNLKVIEISPV